MPIRKLKKKRRNLKIAGQETASERAMRTATQFIMNNPHYDAIIRAIRSGTPNSKIAEHFITKGVFEVNQNTAVGYLQYFKRAKPQLCKPIPPGEGQSAGTDYLDRVFDGGNLIIDEETELLRLIAVQKARIGIAFSNERATEFIMNSNRKEVEELRGLLMDLARLRGKVGNSLDVNLHGYSETVKDDLKGLKQDEGQRNVLATLVTDLAKKTEGAQVKA